MLQRQAAPLVIWSLLALAMGCASPSPEPTASSTGQPTSPPPPGPSASTSLAGRIAFSDFQDVWTINPDGTNLVRITNGPVMEFDASWSPDGTQIAYRVEAGGETEIWIMNADGSGQRKLTDGLSPAWSPDGSLIAFGGRTGLSLIRPDGTGLIVLPDTDGGEYPAWSPDGSQLIYDSNITRQHAMYIAAADGSSVTDLSAAGDGWQVDWSPDGQLILLASHRDRDDRITDVYSMRPDGSDIKRLTNGVGQTPAWSPDGTHIVFSAPGLSIMNADGAGIVRLPTPGIGEATLPDWTP